jgi:hypothetical protein
MASTPAESCNKRRNGLHSPHNPLKLNQVQKLSLLRICYGGIYEKIVFAGFNPAGIPVCFGRP